MLYRNTEGDSMPQKVLLEELPGKKTVRLADNIAMLAQEAGTFETETEAHAEEAEGAAEEETAEKTAADEETSEGTAKERITYRYDEVVFDLPASSEVTAEQISADFDKWWEYGQTDQAGQDEEMQEDADGTVESGASVMTRAEMTVAIQKLQEENTMLSNCLLEMSEVIYA